MQGKRKDNLFDNHLSKIKEGQNLNYIESKTKVRNCLLPITEIFEQKLFLEDFFQMFPFSDN